MERFDRQTEGQMDNLLDSSEQVISTIQSIMTYVHRAFELSLCHFLHLDYYEMSVPAQMDVV